MAVPPASDPPASRPAGSGPPNELSGPARSVRRRFDGPWVEVDESLLARLRAVCPQVDTDDESRVEMGRDWWPLATHWAVAGQVPGLPSVVARPVNAAQVAAVLSCCHQARVPVTPVAGRSGVCGASVALFGGVSLDLCGLAGVVDVDSTSLLVDVAPGTFGVVLEDGLRGDHGLTLGHWPQSMELSTVGGWVACRSAGQYSTRYGKIEDMVVGLEVAMADGRLMRTGGKAPRSATGPDLTQLMVGSEGTLGVVTEARLRVHPLPPAQARGAWGFDTFGGGLAACRRILRRGATPAVLRLYDADESARTFEMAGLCVLVVVDEGDPALVDATMTVVGSECSAGAPLDEALAAQWVENRNHITDLAALTRHGIVADTVEVGGRWSVLEELYFDAMAGIRRLEGTVAASGHQSHAYPDGACLYLTFAGQGPSPGDLDWADRYYRQAWDAVMGSVSHHGGAISHHHGIGLNRGR
ncbi:MAG: FAD-binding oxidoreductase [Acidimicrobiales bacterium]|nr:MAG: FAD-binding oxidoreductase [Acidimicrobiales bacterium]